MKLGIAVALSHGAKLLILDEPTNGLDPVIRDRFMGMLMDFTREARFERMGAFAYSEEAGTWAAEHLSDDIITQIFVLNVHDRIVEVGIEGLALGLNGLDTQ